MCHLSINRKIFFYHLLTMMESIHVYYNSKKNDAVLIQLGVTVQCQSYNKILHNASIIATSPTLFNKYNYSTILT